MTIQFADIIVTVSALALTLLLLTAMLDPPARGGHGPRPASLEQPDTTPSHRGVHQAIPDPRRLWLIQSGEAALYDVPADVQAEALDILESLRALDMFFTDGPRPPRHTGS